ncbi:MAG: BamA/TamA family outer membrane protein [Candidatus Babeliales bacterium]
MPASLTTCVIDVTFDNSVIAQQLQAQFPLPFIAAEITCTADCKIDQTELFYLIGLQKGATVTWSDLLTACTAFQLKRKFKLVTIAITDTLCGKHLDFAFESLWTFGRVTFSGLLLGKDRYKHLYAIESGEPFFIDHHKQLLDAIEHSFKAEGFYNGTISDYLEYQSDTKTVDVHIVLDHQEQFRVQDVDIQLNMPATCDQENCNQIKHKLRSVINTRVHNKRYTKLLVDQAGAAVRRYLAKKGYLEATIAMRECINYNKAAIKLEFMITLHDRREIEFFGNHYFTSNQLLDLIASFGRTAWLVPAEVLAQEFEAAYRAKGFWQIAIETVTEHDRLIFVIREGTRSCLRHVRLEGVTVEDADKMLKKWFSHLIKQPYIDQDELQEQLSKLLAWYQHQGYAEAQILRQEFLSTGKPDTFELVLMIDEGAQRLLSSVDIEGHPELMDCGPFASCKAQLPVPFDTAILHKQRLWLLDHFHELGFLQVRVTPRLTYDGMCASVVWVLENIEKAAIFGKTIVVGRTRTKFEYIQRQLRYKQGDIWDQTALEDSLAALRHLNVFESVYVSPQQNGEAHQERNILLKLVEYDPFEVRFRVGFQQISKNFTFRSGSTYKIGGALLWRNPFKVGDYFCFDADVTKFFRNVSLRYYRPWLGNSPYQTQFKLYSNRYIQPVSKGCKEPLYEVLQQGFLVGLSRAFSRVDTGGNIGIELMETGNLSPAMAHAINFNQELRDRQIPLAFFEGSMLVDFLDDQVNPSRGSLTAVSCKGMFPWKHHAVSFFKILFEQSVFYDPYARLILGAKIRFGYIFAKNFSSIMPPERFFLGGEHSLRSYWADFAPPLGSFINDDGSRVFVPQGGKSMVNACFEARFPIFRNLGGVVFQDLGMLAQNELAELKGGRLLAATGFGLRYLTPIGPVRFDIGFKWHRDTEEEARFAWFLTLGESF